jgi:hypothetical protein
MQQTGISYLGSALGESEPEVSKGIRHQQIDLMPET